MKEEISMRAKEYYKEQIVAMVSALDSEEYLARIYAILKYHKERNEEG